MSVVLLNSSIAFCFGIESLCQQFCMQTVFLFSIHLRDSFVITVTKYLSALVYSTDHRGGTYRCWECSSETQRFDLPPHEAYERMKQSE